MLLYAGGPFVRSADLGRAEVFHRVFRDNMR